jgi:hypothetical protein
MVMRKHCDDGMMLMLVPSARIILAFAIIHSHPEESGIRGHLPQKL